MANVKPIPDGSNTVTPYLTVRNAVRAIEFYRKAFGATELFRLTESGGRIGHAELRIGNSTIMLADHIEDVSPEEMQRRFAEALATGSWRSDARRV